MRLTEATEATEAISVTFSTRFLHRDFSDLTSETSVTSVKRQENMEKFIEIQLNRYRVYLTEAEIISLLARDRALWEVATRRGKAFPRARTSRERPAKTQRKYNV